MELDADKEHFVIARQGERPAKVPALRVSEIIAGRGARVSHEAMLTALRRKIPLFLIDRGGTLLGRLQPAASGDAQPRLRQYEGLTRSETRLTLSRKVIRAKIVNGMNLLRRHTRNHPGSIPASTFTELQRIAALAAEATSIDSLRGFEGAAARLHFASFGAMVKHHRFTGRNRRPPTDPVNALLSYTYAILGGQLAAALEQRGLDPHVGFLHDLKPGRASLALDLLEPWRPWVADRFVIQSLNSGQIRTEHFETEKRAHGVTAFLLNQEGKRAYFRLFDSWMREAAPELSGSGPLAEREARDFLDHLLAGTLDDWTPHVATSR
jgi:CRISPR-associated protein Cas1